MAVLWAVEHFRYYLWGRRVTLITDCSTRTWLFKSQTLSPKLHRWALRLMEYDMDLQWKAGQNHDLPDALSRLPRFETPGEDIDDSFPGDASDRQAYQGARGPILDGVLLSDMGIDETDVPPPENVAAVAGAIATPGMSWEAGGEVKADPAELHSAPERPFAVVLCCAGGGQHPCGTRASERKGCYRPRLEGVRMQ